MHKCSCRPLHPTPSTNPDHHPFHPASPHVTLGCGHLPPLAPPAFTAFPPCYDNRQSLSHTIMMIIANPPFKAQKAEIARFAHPPPLSYLWLLASSVHIVCRPGIRYPLTGVVYGICHTRYLRILGKTIHFFYGIALSDHKKSVA